MNQHQSKPEQHQFEPELEELHRQARLCSLNTTGLATHLNNVVCGNDELALKALKSMAVNAIKNLSEFILEAEDLELYIYKVNKREANNE